MVKKGEYLERPALIDAGGLWIEGLFHRGIDKPGLLICPPIAGEIGMDAPPVAELGFATARVGRASLRFQHRGFGASQGEADATRAVDDARAALSHLEACLVSPRADVAGYRTGALTALALARTTRRVRSVVLIAPHELLDLAGLEHARILVVLPGEQPEEEQEAWRARLEAHPEGELTVVDGADHRFVRGLSLVGERVIAWLERATGRIDDDVAALGAAAPRSEERVGEGDDVMIIER